MPQGQRKAAENLSVLFLDRSPGPWYRWALEWRQDSDLKNSWGFCGPGSAPFTGNVTWASKDEDQREVAVALVMKLYSWQLSVDTWPLEPHAAFKRMWWALVFIGNEAEWNTSTWYAVTLQPRETDPGYPLGFLYARLPCSPSSSPH